MMSVRPKVPVTSGKMKLSSRFKHLFESYSRLYGRDDDSLDCISLDAVVLWFLYSGLNRKFPKDILKHGYLSATSKVGMTQLWRKDFVDYVKYMCEEIGEDPQNIIDMLGEALFPNLKDAFHLKIVKFGLDYNYNEFRKQEKHSYSTLSEWIDRSSIDVKPSHIQEAFERCLGKSLKGAKQYISQKEFPNFIRFLSEASSIHEAVIRKRLAECKNSDGETPMSKFELIIPSPVQDENSEPSSSSSSLCRTKSLSSVSESSSETSFKSREEKEKCKYKSWDKLPK